MNKNSEWLVPRNKISEYHLKIQDELFDAIKTVLKTDPLEQVNIVHECERNFAQWAEMDYAIGVNSGTSALIVGLLGLGVEFGDEVITVGNSDMADTNAIGAVGATAVLCDVKLSDYTIDPDLIEPLITEKTKVIVGVDLYGNPADIKKIQQIAKKHGIKVLHDAALGTFSEDHGHRPGHYADVVVYSTAATKLIHGLGYGGFVCCNSAEIAGKCHLFTEYGVDYSMGKNEPFCGLKYHMENGLNVKMNPTDAAVVQCKMKYFADYKSRRIQTLNWYTQYLKDISGIILPEFRKESAPCVREYAIRAQSDNPETQVLFRTGLIKELIEKRVQASTGFTPCVHKRLIGKKHIWPGSENLKNSEFLDDQIVSLPCDVTTTEENVAFVAEIIQKYVKNKTL